MSADTRAALEEALRAHIADEMPDHPLLTDWYAVCASVGEEISETGYLHLSTDSGTHVQMGLIDIAHRRLNAHFDDDYS